MKKPLLLLVDDDRAVLDALESELAPAVTDLCRIESFDDPGLVLESLPRWAEDRRAVAVTIVDQKMPGMTGVELLAALRATGTEAGPTTFAPARHMRAVLLTGYAGLDSAMASKNEGGADRYIEKPWDAVDMQRQVHRMIRLHHAQAGTAGYLLFRELESPAELRQQFRLRYEVYAHTPDLQYLLPRNPRKLSLDAYDLVSRFYGLFRKEEGIETLIGGLRVIGEASPGAAEAVVNIAQEDDALRAGVARRREYTVELPLKWPDPEVISRFLAECDSRGERVVEIGRLALVAQERGGGLGRSLPAMAILEGVAAVSGFVRAIENTVLNCSARHGAAYSAFGFRNLPGTTSMFTPGSNENQIALWTRPEWVPEPARSRLRSLAKLADRGGGTCRCRNFPACTGGPYETGDFSQMDLMCPRLMQERTCSSPRDSRIADPTGAEFEV